MRTPMPVVVLLLAALAAPALADPPSNLGVAVENIAEAMTSMIVLPASPSGTLSFTLCSSCRTVTLSATPTTRYVINQRDVPLASVAKLFATGTYPAVVTWKLDSPTLLRLEIFGGPSAASRSTSP
jgi:hypothetical protein